MKKTLIITCLLFQVIKFYSQEINFEGKPVDINFSYGLKKVSYCNFYEYKIYNNTELDNSSLNILKEKYLKSGFFKIEGKEKKNIKIKSILKFLWKEKEIICINYSLQNKKVVLKRNLIYISEPNFPITQNFEELLKLSNDAFWEFYNSNDNADYPVINKLKFKAKDSNGILNIQKLAKVIKENKYVLSKHIEE